ncbi:UTP--glucose-1-phosphate uridylyltransferase [Lebetimonas natsushimae]|uniref:UTP--glucose-1-phosphate uridylyltransferase n=1 Tax=Lebetimonas natsushimae TaxID=1936991 RepID=A0A292YA00_9BACT|nr:UTP--glucose-1-phosphate uridylyltransferase GalU [Lebetimonas natsushimae]GAX86867.1 UTP--glucose-1-phosphate uridylyltransferase [Lebetimonas natsushimae]
MIKKALFPAAGYGTRFLPATKSVPKEMLPVVNKPLIHYGIQECMNAGIFEIGFVTGRNKRAIEDYLDFSPELEDKIKDSSKAELLRETNEMIEKCTFTYVRQKEMLGLGHAVLTGEPLIGNNPFAVVLADDLCVGDVLTQMVNLYKKYKCTIVGVEEVDKNEVNKYGIVAGRKIEDSVIMVDDMVEKPDVDKAPSNLAIIGRYILTPDIFNLLKKVKPGKGGEIQLTDAIRMQAHEGMVIAYKFKGKRFDCGSIPGFIEATNYIYENMK